MSGELFCAYTIGIVGIRRKMCAEREDYILSDYFSSVFANHGSEQVN